MRNSESRYVMETKRKWKTTLLVLVSVLLVVAMTACGDESQKIDSVYKESPENMSSELSSREKDSLMHQVAESEITKNFEQYLPEEAFADAVIFGIDRDGAMGTAYSYLTTADYVALKGKAYIMSGSSGEAIIRFEYTEEGIELKEVEWSADGSDHDSWIRENYPEAYLDKDINYDAYSEDGTNKLLTSLRSEVKKVMGVPVETENLLSIDLDSGTYQIIKTIESGEPGTDYQFDTEVVDEGNLSDLNS